MRHTLSVQTTEYHEIIDLTARLTELAPSGDALCFLFMQHTSAALTIVSLEHEAAGDLKAALEQIVPHIDWKHLPAEHTPGHVLSAIIGVSLTIPIRNGRPALGPFQCLVLLEFQGPTTRTIEAEFLPTAA